MITDGYYTDRKGRKVKIMSMSDRWLNNIRKYFKDDHDMIKPIMDEIRRRKNLRLNKSKKLTEHYNRIRNENNN